MHPTIAAILESLDGAGVEITPEQRAAFVRRLQARLGGTKLYMPKRAARPVSNFVEALGGTNRPVTAVRQLMGEYGIAQRTAYRWVRGR